MDANGYIATVWQTVDQLADLADSIRTDAATQFRNDQPVPFTIDQGREFAEALDVIAVSVENLRGAAVLALELGYQQRQNNRQPAAVHAAA